MTTLIAEDLAVQLIEVIREPLAIVEKKDRKLADQAREAASSILLNTGEAQGRVKGDRLYHFNVAMGSLHEVRAAIRGALAWRYVEPPAFAAAAPIIDRLRRVLRGLTNPR